MNLFANLIDVNVASTKSIKRGNCFIDFSLLKVSLLHYRDLHLISTMFYNAKIRGILCIRKVGGIKWKLNMIIRCC